MFHVEDDPARQLLSITYSGEIAVKDMPHCVETIKAILAGMAPGFRLLVDFSGMTFMEAACGPHIGRIMDLCSAKGVASVARVIPDPHKDIGLTILSFFHYDPGVRIMTCDTLEQAKKSLES